MFIMEPKSVNSYKKVDDFKVDYYLIMNFVNGISDASLIDSYTVSILSSTFVEVIAGTTKKICSFRK
jgi:hypothetical protein